MPAYYKEKKKMLVMFCLLGRVIDCSAASFLLLFLWIGPMCTSATNSFQLTNLATTQLPFGMDDITG